MHPGFRNDWAGIQGVIRPYGVSASAPFHALAGVYRARNLIDSQDEELAWRFTWDSQPETPLTFGPISIYSRLDGELPELARNRVLEFRHERPKSG